MCDDVVLELFESYQHGGALLKEVFCENRGQTMLVSRGEPRSSNRKLEAALRSMDEKISIVDAQCREGAIISKPR